MAIYKNYIENLLFHQNYSSGKFANFPPNFWESFLTHGRVKIC